jgi:hypothetical protein
LGHLCSIVIVSQSIFHTNSKVSREFLKCAHSFYFLAFLVKI